MEKSQPENCFIFPAQACSACFDAAALKRKSYLSALNVDGITGLNASCEDLAASFGSTQAVNKAF